MSLDYQTMVAYNLILQLILVAVLGYAVFLAKKKSIQRHCLVLRIAVMAQILAVLAPMSPAMAKIVRRADKQGRDPGNSKSLLLGLAYSSHS